MAKSTKRVGVHGTDAETGRGNGEPKGCAITRAQFEKDAPAAIQLPATVVIKKTFSTGTLGYFAQIEVVIPGLVGEDGQPVKAKGNAQLYIAKSAEAK